MNPTNSKIYTPLQREGRKWGEKAYMEKSRRQ